MTEQSCKIQNCFIQKCRPVHDDPLTGGIPIYISLKDIFGLTQDDNGLRRLCPFDSLGHPLARTSAVAGLNETSRGAASKGNRALERVGVFGLVAWQHCRVCCRAVATDGWAARELVTAPVVLKPAWCWGQGDAFSSWPYLDLLQGSGCLGPIGVSVQVRLLNLRSSF